jgi:hypothetical protein
MFSRRIREVCLEAAIEGPLLKSEFADVGCEFHQAIHEDCSINRLAHKLKERTLTAVLAAVLIKPSLFVVFDLMASWAVCVHFGFPLRL